MTRNQMGMARVLIPLILVVVLGVGGYAAWLHYSVRESTDDAQVDGHIHAVNARIGGIIQAVNVVDNQYVEAGTVLAQIDDRDYRIAVARAEADLANAQAGYDEARAALPLASAGAEGQVSSSQAGLMRAQGGVETAQKELEVARAHLNSVRAAVPQAQTNYTKVSKDLERMRALIAKDEISQQQFDSAVAANDAAKAALDLSNAMIAEAESGVAAADSRITQSKGSLGMAKSESESAKAAPQEIAASKARLAAAQARILQAQAALEQAKTNLGYAVVAAPVAGVVSRKSIELGQVVQAGQPVLALVPLNDTWITANFKETQLESMRMGQPADIVVDAYGGATFKAHVDSIAAATGSKFSLLPAENASGNFVKVVQRVPVKLRLNEDADTAHVLRPGMSVVVTVMTK